MFFTIINYDAITIMFVIIRRLYTRDYIKKIENIYGLYVSNKRCNYITMSLSNISGKDLDNFFDKFSKDVKISDKSEKIEKAENKKESISDDELDELFNSFCKIKPQTKKSEEKPNEKSEKEEKNVKTTNSKDVKAIKKVMEIDYDSDDAATVIVSTTINVNPIFTPNEYSHYTGPFGTKAKFKSPEKEYEWAKTQTKECNKCKEELPLSEFGYNTSGKDPFDRNGYRLRRGDCKECNKMANKGKNEAMKVAKESGIPYKAPEGTPCALCNKKKNNLVFDHNHETNRFRGYLGNECNRSIGMLGENMENMVKILNYINKDEKKNLFWNDTKKQLEIIS